MADADVGKGAQCAADVVGHQVNRRAADWPYERKAFVFQETRRCFAAGQKIMFFFLEDAKELARAFGKRSRQIGVFLNPDPEHDDRHVQVGEDQRLGIRRESLAQEISAREDTNIETRIDLVQACAGGAAIVKMPERDMSCARRQRTERTFTDQVVPGVADVPEFRKEGVFAFRS